MLNTDFKNYMIAKNKRNFRNIALAVLLLFLMGGSVCFGLAGCSSSSEDTSSVAQNLSENEGVFVPSQVDDSNKFFVRNNSSSNYLMKFVDPGSEEEKVSFYVSANSDVNIGMPVSESGKAYELQYAKAGNWFGNGSFFAEQETDYKRDQQLYVFDIDESWELSIYDSSR